LDFDVLIIGTLLLEGDPASLDLTRSIYGQCKTGEYVRAEPGEITFQVIWMGMGFHGLECSAGCTVVDGLVGISHDVIDVTYVTGWRW
jgi:hypothetical protein